MTVLIEVEVVQTGCTAEADTPEGALLAAKTIAREAYDACGGAIKPTVNFCVDGKLVRAAVPENQLWKEQQ